MGNKGLNRVKSVLVLLIALISAGTAMAGHDFSLQLRWKHQFQFAGYYVAQERGYYEQAGLDVTILEGGPNALRPVEDVLAQRVDFAVGNSGVVIERMQGRPVVALAAIMQTSPMVWMVRADSGIYTAQDLARKRLMLMPPPESAELLAMLVVEGIDVDQLNLVPTSHDLNDLINGRVDAYDAYSTNEPFLMQELGIDYRLIAPHEYGVNFYSDVLVAREALIDEHPREVERFIEASLRGWIWAMENVEEAVDLIQANYATEKSREHLLFEARKMMQLIMPDIVRIGHMNPGRWQAIADQYRELGFATGTIDLDGFIHTPGNVNDDVWLYRATGITILAALVFGLIAGRFILLNRRLMHEAGQRQQVEQELREKQNELYRLANTDALTGLWNRIKFEEVAQQEINRSHRYAHPLSLLFVDIDHFKPINDEHGHITGDRVLVATSGLLRQQLRESDYLCRWGGEEFLILLTHTGPDKALEVAEKLRKKIAAAELIGDRKLTVSIGVAELRRGDALSRLLSRADRGLYMAKSAGRNRVELADGSA
jgi:diguanylate cyclase (GGDEF)-like protein